MRFYGSPYQGYVSPDVFKKPVNTGAIGVGIGAAAGTAALGLVAAAISKEPHISDALPMVGLPALGAGFLAYLLRWQLDKPCPPCPGELRVVPPTVTAEGELCPPGFARTPRGCEEIR